MRPDPFATHPARGLARELLRGPCLPGQQKHGVPAAQVEAGQGADGQWYARWNWNVPTTGCATPIIHSPPFPTEGAAIAWGLAKIRDKAASLAANRSDHYTSTDRQWAARILAWLDGLAAPQQLALL